MFVGMRVPIGLITRSCAHDVMPACVVGAWAGGGSLAL